MIEAYRKLYESTYGKPLDWSDADVEKFLSDHGCESEMDVYTFAPTLLAKPVEDTDLLGYFEEKVGRVSDYQREKLAGFAQTYRGSKNEFPLDAYRFLYYVCDFKSLVERYMSNYFNTTVFDSNVAREVMFLHKILSEENLRANYKAVLMDIRLQDPAVQNL